MLKQMKKPGSLRKEIEDIEKEELKRELEN